MCKLQHRNTGNMKKQGNMTSPKVNNASITKYEDAEMIKMLGKEFKSIF
jgi:hypothetical protein